MNNITSIDTNSYDNIPVINTKQASVYIYKSLNLPNSVWYIKVSLLE